MIQQKVNVLFVWLSRSVDRWKFSKKTEHSSVVEKQPAMNEKENMQHSVNNNTFFKTEQSFRVTRMVNFISN